MKIYKTLALGVSFATIAAWGAVAQDGAVIGYSAGFLTDPFQSVLVGTTLKAAEAGGLKTLPATNANGDAGKQISDVQNLIAGGAKGIVAVATDSQAIVPAINAASNAGIPVVAIDMAPAGGKVAMVVRANNVQMGQAACEALGPAIGGKGKVLSLMGDQATTNGRDRTTGFKECMKAKYPDVQVIEQPTNWKTEMAATAAQTVLGSTPDLTAIYMQSDSVMLNAVQNALKNANMLHKSGEPGHVYTISVDATPFALKQIRAGLHDAAVSQPLDGYVKYGVDYLKRAMAGETFKAGPTDHGSEVIDVDGMLMDLLPAPLVTSENAADPALWGNAAK
ncbi:sugar ABC transporter substrate-binding protein [Rhizobium leguminosarum]|uniref:sugar ABC transporter substrate-binding protein n=1 Tax=Rhizobium leguminosarum TaxID=384 RepID=UPI001C906D4F|nr:sugar ABC transporter substrate-binding protein [Rhizobium leguminosarum]MBY2924313.1 sugar ABC transporter substrate-binding protein [Rhizobium leguminosarum]